MDGRSAPLGMRRGAAFRCPQCGKGALYCGYLKVRSPCAECGNDNAQYPADDAPPYFTILIVGHLVIAPMLIFNFIWTWPIQWVLLTVLPSLTILTLVLLPVVKGAAVGLMWAVGMKRQGLGEARIEAP